MSSGFINTQGLYCSALLRVLDKVCDGLDSGMFAGPRYFVWKQIKAQETDGWGGGWSVVVGRGWYDWSGKQWPLARPGIVT